MSTLIVPEERCASQTGAHSWILEKRTTLTVRGDPPIIRVSDGFSSVRCARLCPFYVNCGVFLRILPDPLVLCVLFALSLLSVTSCGRGDRPDDSATLTLWEMMDPPERELLATQITTFEAEHPGIAVEVTHFGVEDVRSQFLTAVIGGGGPDIVYGPSDQVGPFSAARSILPMDDLFGEDFLARFAPMALDTLAGHVWDIPDQFGNHLTLVCNTDLVPTPPKNTDELIRMAKQHTTDFDGDGTLDRYGLVFESKEPFWLVPWLAGFGGWVMDDNAHPTLDSPAMADALAFLRDLRHTHQVLPADCDYELADMLFKEGRAAMIINGPWAWSGYRDAGVSIRLALLPRVSETGLLPAPMISHRGYSIARSCPEARRGAALDLIRFLVSDKAQRDRTQRLGILPSLASALQDPTLRDDPILSASLEQALAGRRMPVVPGMRAVWDAMRPGFQNVMNRELEPAEAAQAMQEDALKKIAEMDR